MFGHNLVGFPRSSNESKSSSYQLAGVLPSSLGGKIWCAGLPVSCNVNVLASWCLGSLLPGRRVNSWEERFTGISL